MVYPGFDYEFDSLQSKENEFDAAYSSLIAGAGGGVPLSLSDCIIRPILMALVPMILKLVSAISSSSFGEHIVTSQ